MEKSLLLSLSVALAVWCAGQPVRPGIACDCSSQAVRDSLITRYIDSGAERYGYNNPRWGRYCDSLIRICPGVAEAYQLKAIPFIKYGDYATAFPLEDKAVELNPVIFTSYRAFLKCIFTKDYRGAIADFTKAQQLVPNSYEMDHTFFFYIGLCYLELKNYKPAEENLKRDIFIQTGGDTSKLPHFNTLFYTGVLYYEMKKYPLAEKYLLTCLKVYHQHPDASYFTGLVYERMNRKALAKNYLQLAKQSLEDNYGINEGNVYYTNYPHQIRLHEVAQALKKYR